MKKYKLVSGLLVAVIIVFLLSFVSLNFLQGNLFMASMQQNVGEIDAFASDCDLDSLMNYIVSDKFDQLPQYVDSDSDNENQFLSNNNRDFLNEVYRILVGFNPECGQE